MIDQERLEVIKMNLLHRHVNEADIDWLISTVEEQEDEIKHRGKLIEHIGNTAGKLNEYLQGITSDGWGVNVVDVAIRLMEEQQKEIERLNKAVEKEMHTGYTLEGQVHDVKEKLEKENARLRKALEFYADRRYASRDGGEKARKALEGTE